MCWRSGRVALGEEFTSLPGERQPAAVLLSCECRAPLLRYLVGRAPEACELERPLGVVSIGLGHECSVVGWVLIC